MHTATKAEGDARLLGKAVTRAAQVMGFRHKELASILGVSEATASRLVAGDYELAPGSTPWEFAVLLVRIFRSLDALVGSRDEVMRTWLGSHNRGINGVPAALMVSAEGMVRVLDYLDANGISASPAGSSRRLRRG